MTFVCAITFFAGTLHVSTVEAAPQANSKKAPGKPDSKKPAQKSSAKKKAILGTSVGEKIKEISGEDVEGEKFSLSDYEGKVIMLDFWGDW